ncbi:tRNA (adenosine(37)-N6)-threonylcarbamoyltransferase complex dimerization subunit type 1 TsaB [Pengzhenrongella sicca]|uniref:tRNA (Adenosine(37)-N6)-threonylcarbamoyltransferase complex dimerization subunit type 1 TsaB n=1 Tax=Pengzhenrongella sicca TaxID=2819238 RepID=A0A8A4ZDB1_9MICO|nr:tRNA (adenosine(37)-N6)-threonylcarbamoyltransferase complex dimerization subunit type 1 TsaB [Pengzhenrongella sicca]QTE29904.1 tRNA (adenosine(37)-N6)-threonylcarbamoyltransferase complex dimerization subunit type 1 TsaB [Pengzhenrongella sicca]
MPVLALDTSAAVAVTLLADDGAVLAARVVHEERRHSEQLAPMIADVLAATGTDRSALTAIVVGTGPAPFTGLRVGLVTARTLGLALGIPVLGVCSLDAIAARAAQDQALAPGAEVLALTDARRREVYWARYRVVAAGPGLELVAGPGVQSAAQLVADGLAAGAVVVVGPGAGLYPELPATAGGEPAACDPAILARLALDRAARGEALPTEPLYLRRPDVMPPAERKRALG